MFKNKKIAIALLSTGIFTYSMPASAQIPTTDAISIAMNKIFAAAQSSAQAVLDQAAQAMQQIQTKVSDMQHKERELADRKIVMDKDFLDFLRTRMPTLSSCNEEAATKSKSDAISEATATAAIVESQSGVNSGSTSSKKRNYSGGGGPGGGGSKTPAGGGSTANMQHKDSLAVRANVNSTAEALNNVIAGRADDGICTINEASLGWRGCKGKGEGIYAGGDISFNSLLGNINKNKIIGGQRFANFSIDAKGQAVATKFMSDSMLGIAPMVPTKEQAPYAEEYGARYGIFNARLDTAKMSLSDLLLWKSEIIFTKGLNSKFKQWWDTAGKTLYTELWGGTYTIPEKPSLYDFYRTQVFGNYALSIDISAKQPSADQSLREISTQMALNNVLELKQVDQNEKIIGMLASMVAHQLNPITGQDLQAEMTRLQGRVLAK